MILGEALNRRSDLQKRIAQLEDRIKASVLVQEGDEPPEDADELLEEHAELCDELEALIAQINLTNATAALEEGSTLTEALARRDVLGMRQSALRAAVRTARGERDVFGAIRYSRSEIRMMRQIKVGEVQERLDALAKAQRQLDNQLQEKNWTTELTTT